MGRLSSVKADLIPSSERVNAAELVSPFLMRDWASYIASRN